MKKEVEVLLYILVVTLILFTVYQNRQQTEIKKELGNYNMENFEIIKVKTNQILRYINENNLESDKLLIYAGESEVCLYISQKLGIASGRMPAYFNDISNRLKKLSEYISNGNQDKEILADKKKDLVIILGTLQESYELFEKENGESLIKWYKNSFNGKYASLFGVKINNFFNEKAKENKLLEIH